MAAALRSCRRALAASRATQRLSLAALLSPSAAPVAAARRSPAFASRALSSQTFERAPGADSERQPHVEAPADPETQILQHALRHVVEQGWTIEALAVGASDLGFPSVAHGMFERGAVELVDFFMDDCNQKLRAKLAESTEQLQDMSVTDRIKFGVRARLELLEPVIATWPQAMALGALPQNAPTTMKKLATMADDIWYFAGDQSSDASWYTKRAVLTAVYASTELYMLSDHSAGFEDTWAFLDRRVDETIALGELPRNLNDVAGMATIGLQSIFSAVTSLAGPLGAQIVANSPLANVPNPISAVGNIVPPSVASTLASGFPPNPLSGVTGQRPGAVSEFELKDLHEIDEELEKLGGAHDKPSA